jgi:hypothetical protein
MNCGRHSKRSHHLSAIESANGRLPHCGVQNHEDCYRKTSGELYRPRMRFDF